MGEKLKTDFETNEQNPDNQAEIHTGKVAEKPVQHHKR